jgi:hypothetical protein
MLYIYEDDLLILERLAAVKKTTVEKIIKNLLTPTQEGDKHLAHTLRVNAKSTQKRHEASRDLRRQEGQKSF